MKENNIICSYTMLNLRLAWMTKLTNNEYWNITKYQQKFSIIIYNNNQTIIPNLRKEMVMCSAVQRYAHSSK